MQVNRNVMNIKLFLIQYSISDSQHLNELTQLTFFLYIFMLVWSVNRE